MIMRPVHALVNLIPRDRQHCRPTSAQAQADPHSRGAPCLHLKPAISEHDSHSLPERSQAAHPGLQASTALQSFLEASEEDFALDVSRQAQQEGGGAKKKLASTLQLFRDLGASTASLVTGRSLEEEEDPEYLKACAPASSAPALACSSAGLCTGHIWAVLAGG